MLNFRRLDKDVESIRKYLDDSPIEYCNLTVGVKYLWRNDSIIDYAIFNDTLIMKETCVDYKDGFYYPIGKDVLGALKEIEEYAKVNGGLKFCYIDNEHVLSLAERYSSIKVFSIRDWSDYIYDAESFKIYSGKKFSGQRNHKNKFCKLYPNYKFKVLTENDLEKVKVFLKEYEKETEFSLYTEKEEEQNLLDYIENCFSLKQFGAYIEVDEKIIALSIGENVKDTLYVHVEKALKEYEGIYPTMASEFAKTFAVNGIKKINREDDCGDSGLRISKLQYHPIEIKDKNIIEVKTAFDRILPPVIIKTKRLLITEIKENDDEYRRLYTDELLNTYWGYDYKEDLKGEPTKEYFYSFMKGLKDKKEEYSLAVNLDGKMIGELVLWNFGFDNTVEIGFRFFREYQGKGYAYESASALIDYAFSVLKVNKVLDRCNKKNIPSFNLITKLGFNKIKEDNEYFYFEK